MFARLHRSVNRFVDSSAEGRRCRSCWHACRGEHQHCARCDVSFCSACREAEHEKIAASVMAMDPEVPALMMDDAFEARLRAAIAIADSRLS